MYYNVIVVFLKRRARLSYTSFVLYLYTWFCDSGTPRMSLTD